MKSAAKHSRSTSIVASMADGVVDPAVTAALDLVRSDL
jgi:hypothetical protein